jgi:hypothetical protein
MFHVVVSVQNSISRRIEQKSVITWCDWQASSVNLSAEVCSDSVFEKSPLSDS